MLFPILLWLLRTLDLYLLFYRLYADFIGHFPVNYCDILSFEKKTFFTKNTSPWISAILWLHSI